MQFDTSLRVGANVFVLKHALAAPQTERILHVHAQRHRDYQRRSKYGCENKQFRWCLIS